MSDGTSAGGGTPTGGAAPASTATPTAPAAAPSTSSTPAVKAPEASTATPNAVATPPSSSKVKIGEREIDPHEWFKEVRESVGDENVVRVDGLAKNLRRLVTEAGMSKKELAEARADLAQGRIHEVLARVLGSEDKADAALEEALGRRLQHKGKPKDVQERDLVKTELEQLKAERERYQSEARERTIVAQAAKAQENFSKQFTASLVAAGVDPEDLKENPAMLGEMVAHVQPEFRADMTRDEFALLLSESARAVARRWNEHPEKRFGKLPAEKRKALIVAHLATLDGAALAEILGDEGARKFRAYDAARVRERQSNGQFAQKAVPASKPTNGAANAEKSPVHVDSWLKDRW